MTNPLQSQLDKVFLAYDIRGTTPDQLNEEFYELLGKAIVTHYDAKRIVVGHDIRNDSKKFLEAMIKGMTSLGCDVVNIGEIATEMIYYATGEYDEFDAGATVTASHNPSGWNGCKIVGRGATALSKDSGLFDIKQIILDGSYRESTDTGKVENKDIYPEFKQKILSFLKGVEIKPLKLVVDAGNGIGGKLFDYVFGEMPFDVEKMYFEPDGEFPNHVPDPLKEENVKEMRARITQTKADLGIAIDGDADRALFIDNEGLNFSGIYTGAAFAKYMLKESPNETIVIDPRIVWPMSKEIEKAGGRSVMSKVGHSFYKEVMKKEKALFGVELSLHFYYRDFYYADSGMTSIAFMLRYLFAGENFTDEIKYLLKTYPNSGEINYVVTDIPSTITTIKEHYKEGVLNELDGISIEFPDWRFNVRPSNTQPLLRLTIESMDKSIIIEKFKELQALIGGTRDNVPPMEELRNL